MRTADFDYHLPADQIAQHPLEDRDASRLLHLERSTDRLAHRSFGDLPVLLKPGDRLIFNDTRVVPARIFATKSTGARIELLFVERIDDLRWIAMTRPAKRLPLGTRVFLEQAPAIALVVQDMGEDGKRTLCLESNTDVTSIDALLERYGVIPLPPYIERLATRDDLDRYQTIYADKPGAIAAPTAGLHFTSPLLGALKSAGVDSSYLTLHVGIGTFKPVSEEDPADHPMHFETYTLPQQTVDEIHTTKSRGGRIIAVGTTVVRVLEHCAQLTPALLPSTGRTNLFILPGFTFKIVDALITNFHLPRSTLLMLVSAFAGKERVMQAYHEAVMQHYRFFSYGDAMFIE